MPQRPEPEPAETFDSALAAWHRWQGSPWGRLRYRVAEANLDRRLAETGLGDGSLRVLDLGGGDGVEAVRLASRGHHVTVVDHAPAMLAAARRRARQAEVLDRLTTVQAEVTEVPREVVGTGFDVVLCHNLVQYLPDPTPALTTATAAARPGGLLSVIALNRHSAVLVAAVRENDPPSP